MPTIKQYTDNYVRWREMLRQNAERIADSSVSRAWLNKNVGRTDPTECLEVALKCIYDLTGDETMLINAQKIEEGVSDDRKHDVQRILRRPK